jgi:Ca-activated chloride channel homolog
MKRLVSISLLISMLSASTLFAQTRPRRVGDRASVPPTESSAPSQPPVLRGNNNPNSSQPKSTPAPAQNEPEEVDAGDVIKVNTTLVTIPLSVMDRDGRYVPNLMKDDFRIWEEGVEQEVAYFSSVDKPFSVVLMIDTSNSTRFRLEEIQDAAIEFVRQLRPDDQVMVVSFDDRVRVLSEFTTNRNRLRDAILDTETGNGTRLYDAVHLVINQRLNRISGRKAIVLFTDGVDTTSRQASYDDNIRDAEELDALVYPIQYDTYADVNSGGSGWPAGQPSPMDILAQILGNMSRGGRRGGRGGRGGGGGLSRQDYEIANDYLRELAEKTGARQYQAETTQNLASAFANIAEELRRQYSLGFYPKNPAQVGERRQIRVRVNRANLAVRARDSYVFSPPAGGQENASAQPTPPVMRRKLWDRP